jgi:hypothetical protein
LANDLPSLSTIRPTGGNPNRAPLPGDVVPGNTGYDVFPDG